MLTLIASGYGPTAFVGFSISELCTDYGVEGKFYPAQREARFVGSMVALEKLRAELNRMGGMSLRFTETEGLA